MLLIYTHTHFLQNNLQNNLNTGQKNKNILTFSGIKFSSFKALLALQKKESSVITAQREILI